MRRGEFVDRLYPFDIAMFRNARDGLFNRYLCGHRKNETVEPDHRHRPVAHKAECCVASDAAAQAFTCRFGQCVAIGASLPGTALCMPGNLLQQHKDLAFSIGRIDRLCVRRHRGECDQHGCQKKAEASQDAGPSMASIITTAGSRRSAAICSARADCGICRM